MIKAVLFDLDGTLLNRDASVELFIDAQYKHLHEYVGHIEKGEFTSRFIELDCRGYVWKDRVYQQLVKEFKIVGLTWEQLLQEYIDYFHQYCVPFPNLHEMLQSLVGQSISLGIISNGKGQFQMANIKALGIEHYFETILISETEGIKKPDPRIFEKALQQLDVPANACLFVGDHPDNDVKASRDVGMLGVWKKDSQWDEVVADYVVKDLMEVCIIIEELLD
ncbi:HAD family hydrolase [Sporosarcina sp. YIM B06819]|uniref:HAD family hydrolase n=1 Tax=Sporosarcina sp. YIM B06819 TaxID=3081769 RepID=UPI00298D08FC|nr:HAD family hydrolase [Sporosarcina sp. YIM B06819]